MLQKESEAVPESNGPVALREEFGSGEPTLAHVYRIFKERFGRWDRKLDEMVKYWRSMDQCLADLEPDARHSRLAMVADGQANARTRECTEGTATAVQRCMGMAVLSTGLTPIRYVLPASEMTALDLRHPLVQGRMSWSTTLLRRPTRVSHPWRYAQQPPAAYFSPAKPLRPRRSPSTGYFSGLT